MDIREQLSNRRTKLFIRVTLATFLILNISFVGFAYANRYDSVEGPTANTEIGDKVAEKSNGTTVITTQGLIPTVEVPQAAISEPNGGIYAIGPSGEIIYKNTTYHSYWDVDPVPDTRATVMFAAAEFVSAKEYGTESHFYIRHVQTVNLTDGRVKKIYSERSPGGWARWHDVDRYDEDSILVADITDDRVLIINVTSGLVEWSWEADDAFHPTSGGNFGEDWTHLNDVELLPDGRIMADLRNQDVVIFLDPNTGIQEEWTLGEDDDYEILNEQHNPDYIPESYGGPAVVVADSNNNRIVEYQRENGHWNESWVWQDSQMNWPRDADRLPDGNTLVTDTGSGRVFEINKEGETIWSVTTDNPYEAERLGTGDESQGGESATHLQLQSRTVTEKQSGFKSLIKSLIPGEVINAISFVKPVWMGFYHVGSLIAILGIILIWPPLEYYWSEYELKLQTPFVLGRK